MMLQRLIDTEISCQVVACISIGNECLVSDEFATLEVNPCNSVRVDIIIIIIIIIIEKINNVRVRHPIPIVATQSKVDVQLPLFHPSG
jgi:hypothetical protein